MNTTNTKNTANTTNATNATNAKNDRHVQPAPPATRAHHSASGVTPPALTAVRPAALALLAVLVVLCLSPQAEASLSVPASVAPDGQAADGAPSLSTPEAPDAAPAGAKTPGAALGIGAGMSWAPIYEGSSTYTLTPLPVLRARATTQGWGTFRAGFPEGLRWDLPTGSRLGAAMLANYDRGRDERIRVLGGHNTRLQGMGDLNGTPVAGGELNWDMSPYRLFIRGLQALRTRQYGGEDLGRTAYAQAGVASGQPLADDLMMTWSLFGTWSDRDDMMARFGVTPAQAGRSGFAQHAVGGGMRDVTLQWGVGWQWQPQVSLEGGVRLTRLSSSAVRNSPLVDDTLGGGLFANAVYTF